MVQQMAFAAGGGNILIIIPVIAPPHKENSRVMPKAAIAHLLTAERLSGAPRRGNTVLMDSRT